MSGLIIFCAKYLIAAPFAALAALAPRLPAPRLNLLVLQAAVLLPLAYLLARLAGLFFVHEQPFAAEGFEPLVPHEVGNSFPSDHTALAVSLAGLMFLYHRGAGIVLAAAALLVAWGRVAAGLHYPVDVAAGALIGMAAAYVAYLLSPALQRALTYWAR